MIDNDMTNILKNFTSAGSEGGITDAKSGEAKVNTAAQEKNAIKSLLEGLDAQQKSVNQMPGQHDLAKNGAKHPASKYLVGGEQDEDGFDIESPEEELEINNSPTIQPGVNVRIGHHVAGGSGIDGEVVRIEDDVVVIRNPEGKMYKGKLKNTTVSEGTVEEDTITQRTPPKTQMNKKQSFKDIFRSMDETEEELASRFKKELHDEREERALNKGTNGKFDLAERFYDGEELLWGDELLEDLKGLLHDAESYEDIRDGVLSLIRQYEQE